MMARRLTLALLGGALAGLVTGCGGPFPNSYRFRMTVEVDTPDGIRTGSSVYEVSAANTPKLLPEEGVRVIEVRGEALVLDLPSGPVFVLMKPESPDVTGFAQISMATLDPQFQSMADSVNSAGRLGGSSIHKGEVKRTNWPMMVRFRDINDPKSVQRVDPQVIKVKRIVMETTRDSVTIGIENLFPPWFEELYKARSRLSGRPSIGTFSNDLADNMSPGSFTTEIGK